MYVAVCWDEETDGAFHVPVLTLPLMSWVPWHKSAFLCLSFPICTVEVMAVEPVCCRFNEVPYLERLATWHKWLLSKY